jgi:amidase
MARNVADLALLLSVQAGYDRRAPLSMESDGSEFLGALDGPLTGKRIGWLADFGGFTPCDPEVLSVCEAALKTFEALGCAVEPARPDYPLDKVWRAFLRLRHWQAGFGLKDLYADPAKQALLKPEAMFEIENGLALSAFEVMTQSVVRSEWSEAVRRLFERFDYLIAPTAQVFPFDGAETWPRQVAGQAMATYHEWMKANCLVTMSGCPALAVPAGFSAAGLPMGLQIIAPVHEEFACLRLAAAYEAAAPWTEQRPPPAILGG